MVQHILQSPIPFLCFIYPRGAHAGSAGAILLQACHLNGAMPATNLGAATPVSLQQSKGLNKNAQTLQKKITNDTVSWLESLAKMRKRNVTFARDIVQKAKAVDAYKAKELGAIDVLASSLKAFLDFCKGKKVLLAHPEKGTEAQAEAQTEAPTEAQAEVETEVKVGDIIPFEEDFRYHLLRLISDPQLTYLLFMGSLGLLYFEITHPGTFVPGILGAMGLVLSLISFHQLEVQWGGLLLLLLGLALLIGEIWISSFGILAIGGLVAMTLGSFLLFDIQQGSSSLPFWTFILPIVLTFGALFLTLSYLMAKTLKKKKGDLVLQASSLGEVVQVEDGGYSGQLSFNGEIWPYKSKDSLKLQDEVIVVGREGRFLEVLKQNSTTKKPSQ